MTKGEQLKKQIEAFAPLIISIVLLVNTYLSAKGIPCIGLTDNDITTVVSGIAGVVAVIYTWWENNNVTVNAQLSQEVLDGLNSGAIEQQDVENLVDPQYEEVDVTEEVEEVVERSESLDDIDE